MGKESSFKAGTKSIFDKVNAIKHRVDVNTMDHILAGLLQLNEIGLVMVDFNSTLTLDEYNQVAGSGSFVVDRISNVAIGASMVRSLEKQSKQKAISDMNYEGCLAAFNREVGVLSGKYFS